MRTVLAFVVAMLTLCIADPPVLASAHPDDIPALESIHMIDALTGWAVTAQPDANALLRTTDGGIHWTDVTPRDSSGRHITVYDIVALTPLIAWVGVYEGTLADTTEILHTFDGGQAWSRAIPVHRGSFHFINAHDGWLISGVGAAGSMEVDIYRTTDSGETWVKVESTTYDNESSGLPFDGDKYDVTPLNATTGWVTGQVLGHDWMYLYVTRDGGRTWRQQMLPLPPRVTSPWHNATRPPMFFAARDGILPVYYSNLDPQSYRTIASALVFYVTHDGGTTWTFTTPVPVTSYWDPLSFADVDHGWIIEGGTLYVTSNGGRQWMKIQPVLPFADVKQLDFISPQIGWALRQTPPFLMRTLDGGHTWESLPYTISRQ